MKKQGVRRQRAKQRKRDTLFEVQRGKCFYCLYALKDASHLNATLDHLIPKSKGGGSHQFNLVLCCEECNKKEDNKLIPESWIQRRLELFAGVIRRN